jgi:Carbonic anhydrase
MCDSCGVKGAVHRPALDRRSALALGFGLVAAAAAPFRALADANDKPPPKPENVVSPEEALDRLMEGNARYVSGAFKRPEFLADREALMSGQNPYAGVLSCADSRIVPEFAFDSARGDLFVCRVAGNFVNPDNLAKSTRRESGRPRRRRTPALQERVRSTPYPARHLNRSKSRGSSASSKCSRRARRRAAGGGRR